MLDIATAPQTRILEQIPSHIHFAAHPALRGVVAHYTVTFPEKPVEGQVFPETLTLLPDASGCLIFTLNDPVQSHFWGATTKAVTVQYDFETTPLRFFVEFAPGGAHQLTGYAMSEFTDKTYPLQDVQPCLFENIKMALQENSDISALLAKVDALLLAQLRRVKRHFSANAPMAMLSLLKATQTAAPVRMLGDRMGYSERHVSRLFEETLGVGVKACQRILRVSTVLDKLSSKTPLTELALEAGYYDQSHFNHDFKAVCGVSPSVYLAHMSAFYKENHKL